MKVGFEAQDSESLLIDTEYRGCFMKKDKCVGKFRS